MKRIEMKPLINYAAQKGCLRLSEFIKEKEETPPKEERDIELSGIKFVKNLNKRHGKDFYVAFRGDEWIARIFYDLPLSSYVIRYEDGVSEQDKETIRAFGENLNDGLK
ncbi:MAG: hypothetical protein V3V78_00490 [Candidatus Woesearchaeota archaeon]